MNKISTFIEQNMRWVIGIAFAIIILYLNTRYVSVEEYDNTKSKVSALENELSLFKQDVKLFKSQIQNEVADVEQRQDKKVKIQNSLIDEVDEIENEMIEIRTQIKYLHK